MSLITKKMLINEVSKTYWELSKAAISKLKKNKIQSCKYLNKDKVDAIVICVLNDFNETDSQ